MRRPLLAFALGLLVATVILIVPYAEEPSDTRPRLTSTVDARLAVLEEQMRSMEAARALQFSEFMRRLSELNGEAGRLRAMQESYVPREVFEAKVKELDGNLRQIGLDQSNITGRMAVVGAIAAMAAAALVKWLPFGRKQV